ncbi:MAG: hypothetical protein ABID79_02525 [Elusimicrobiota bacterium]
MIKNIVLAIFSFLIFASFASMEVFAQVKVYPEVQEIIAPPGETIKGNVWVIGPEDAELEVEIQPEDWSKGRKNGVDWLKIKPEEKFVVKPKKMKEVKWVAVVPKDAKGDLVAQVFFASIGSKLGEVKIGTRVPQSIYITVKGTEKSVGGITNFNVECNNGNYGFAVLFKNTGNVHLTTRGKIILKELQGGTTRALELNPWFYRSGESFALRSWMQEGLAKGNYESTATVFYTDPAKNEKKVETKIKFSIDEDGKVIEK